MNLVDLLCVCKAVKALMRLFIWAGTSEWLLFAYAISNKFSYPVSDKATQAGAKAEAEAAQKAQAAAAAAARTPQVRK